MPKYTEQRWLQSPLGRYLTEREQAMFDRAVSDLFGFNALQVGMPEVDFLQHCRIPHRLKAGVRGDVDLHCLPEQLPIASTTVDLLALPHVLEFADNPHNTLREAERILMPEGHLVISGFNPVSLWGARRAIGNKTGFPWQGRFLSLLRIKDWLALLGFEVVAGSMGGYVPPLQRDVWLQRCDFMDNAGDRWWPMLGGVYFLVAKKRVAGMRLIRPKWQKSRVAQVFMPKPTQKTECKKIKYEQ